MPKEVEMAVVHEGRVAREAWHVIDHGEIRRQLGSEAGLR